MPLNVPTHLTIGHIFERQPNQPSSKHTGLSVVGPNIYQTTSHGIQKRNHRFDPKKRIIDVIKKNILEDRSGLARWANQIGLGQMSNPMMLGF